MADKHFILVTHNATSHLNPTLLFAKRLISNAAEATILITISARRRVDRSQITAGLNFETFSDGYDDGAVNFSEIEQYLAEFRRRGSLALRDLLSSRAKEGRPFTCVIHTLLHPWVITVARDFHVPTAVLWIQSAIVLNIIYHYFNGYDDIIKNENNKNGFPLSVIQFPGLPLLTDLDIPSFLTSDVHGFVLKEFEEKFEIIARESYLTILLDTFDALEHDSISAIPNLNLIPIGPLAFFAESDQARDDLGLTNWMNSKPESSIVYVSFGSICKLSKKQMEEIAKGLLEFGNPFIWVILRSNENGDGEKLSCLDELEEQGKVVTWCSQVEVLCHSSLGCFVTHCGWNSTVESVVAGVPVVAFPQWVDQSTNAKLMEDVWKIGVRVVKGNEEGIVKGKEIVECLNVVMGEGGRGKEMRENAKKWRCLAIEDASGSSDVNLKSFVNQFC